MEAEMWRKVSDWGEYEVSTHGRLRRAGRLMNLTQNPRGHVPVKLSDGPRRMNKYMHVLVMAAFMPPPEEGQVCVHVDGDRANNALANLRWGSLSEARVMPVRVRRPKRVSAAREISELRSRLARVEALLAEGMGLVQP